MALKEDHEGVADRPRQSTSERNEINADPYDFNESYPRFRVFVGSERRPTGLLIRAPDENEARRQLMIAAIRLGFDRRGEAVTLQRIDDPDTAR